MRADFVIENNIFDLHYVCKQGHINVFYNTFHNTIPRSISKSALFSMDDLSIQKKYSFQFI